MGRDQRVEGNWALLYAQEKALERKVPLLVAFNLFVIPARATLRQYGFMLQGLEEVATELATLQIPFYLLKGKAEEVVIDFAKKHHISELVLDVNPLRYATERRKKLAALLSCAVTEVDTHNIIPVWQASDKEEFAAYTFRPKVHRALGSYLTDFPKVKKHLYAWDKKIPIVAWQKVLKQLQFDTTVGPTAIIPGTKAAKKVLKEFIVTKLERYHEDRNDPTLAGVSGLSPYLHFGQLSAQQVAYEIAKLHDVHKEARDAFLEELIVRRELADNYCFYNKDYNKVEGAHAWAKKTLLEHKNDPREHIYAKEQLESASTHDDLWNAMQRQMVLEGKMHGWCRMYWAKKILEWTPDVQTAIDIALYLNDKYELDGLDPNGVVGVMWSICGVHDRAWNERNIFGKIRYMNYAGAKRKFDIKTYMERYGSTEKTLFT
jgi:deoxyribodipyrimidine photo-lyase